MHSILTWPDLYEQASTRMFDSTAHWFCRENATARARGECDSNLTPHLMLQVDNELSTSL